MPFEFLSDEWFAEVEKLTEGAAEAAPGAGDLVLNLTIVEGPSGDKELNMSGGKFGQGHVADAPTKLTVPYDVAKAMFVDGDQQAPMQAFMSGKIKVEGDMSKLMAMQGGAGPTPEQAEIAAKIKEITA